MDCVVSHGHDVFDSGGAFSPHLVERGGNPWIQQQVEVVQSIRATFTEEIASLYNIFSPIYYLKRWFRTATSRGD